MPYEYLDDIATADIAFSAWGNTVEDMFISAAQATLNVLVEDIAQVDSCLERKDQVTADVLDILLYRFLEKMVFYKDAENLLLKPLRIEINHAKNAYVLSAVWEGEKIDPEKHSLYLDIKAVTLHQLKVEERQGVWKSMVVLDV